MAPCWFRPPHGACVAVTDLRNRPESSAGNQSRHGPLLTSTNRQTTDGAGCPSHAQNGGAVGMHSVFYIIGVIVVVLAVLSLLGLR